MPQDYTICDGCRTDNALGQTVSVCADPTLGRCLVCERVAVVRSLDVNFYNLSIGDVQKAMRK